LFRKKLSEFQALLDNDIMYNKTPGITEAGTDDYYMTYATWQSARTILRNGYIWKPDILKGQPVPNGALLTNRYIMPILF